MCFNYCFFLSKFRHFFATHKVERSIYCQYQGQRFIAFHLMRFFAQVSFKCQFHTTHLNCKLINRAYFDKFERSLFSTGLYCYDNPSRGTFEIMFGSVLKYLLSIQYLSTNFYKFHSFYAFLNYFFCQILMHFAQFQ